MTQIAQLFDRMDSWRHLPKYQLERRADLFFSLYLPEVLTERLGIPFITDLIPEFPLRKQTLGRTDHGDATYNVDYLALSASLDQAILVELKTDERSRQKEQDEYLAAAQRVGLPALLSGLIETFRAKGMESDIRHKYYRLLGTLDRIGILGIPQSLRDIMQKDRLQGLTKASYDVKITCPTQQCHVVYVQPNGEGPDIISFDDFRAVVARHPDAVSARFAQSLEEWAKIPAGTRPLGR